MIDARKLAPTLQGVDGEFGEIVSSLHKAAEIIETADRVPDETVKKPLLDGARQMLQNVTDALDGRRTDGLVIAEEDDE